MVQKFSVALVFIFLYVIVFGFMYQDKTLDAHGNRASYHQASWEEELPSKDQNRLMQNAPLVTYPGP